LGYFFPKESLPKHLQSASDAVGRIFGNGTFGTCFVVEGQNGQYLVSAKHCFYDRNGKVEEKTAILSSGRSIQYNLSKAQQLKDDILIVKLTEKLPIHPLKLACEDDQNKVVVLGLPHNYLNAFSCLQKSIPEMYHHGVEILIFSSL